MPLHEITAEEAFARSAGNASSRWPKRGRENRLAPRCLPQLAPRFAFDGSEAFFAIGSCFARNIEDYLVRLGLRVITREKSFAHYHAKDKTSPNGVLIKFTPGSIEYELATALGDRPPLPDESYIVSDGRGNWYDLNLSVGTALASREAAVARRAEVRGVFQRLGEADVMFLTLGLIEEWHDLHLGIVIGAAPAPAIIAANPGRFVCRISTYDEALASVRRVMALARGANPQIKIILTVSPVPLARSFGPQDVIVGNCYSKSLLRAVAQTIAAELSYVDYFPSYEMVMLSDGQMSWADDLRHVRDAMVGDVMTIFHQAYFPQAEPAAANSARYIAARKFMDGKDYRKAFELLEAIAADFADDEKFHTHHLTAAERSQHHGRALELARRGMARFGGRSRYAKAVYENAFMLGHYEEARGAITVLSARPRDKFLAAAFSLRLAMAIDDDDLLQTSRRQLLAEIANGAKLAILPPLLRQLAEAAVAGVLLEQQADTVPA